MSIEIKSHELPALQRRLALERANGSRSSAAVFKARMVAGGSRSRVGVRLAAGVLVEDPGLVGVMRVHEFLEAVPTIGPVGARRILVGLGVWPLRRVRELSLRQRVVLSGVLLGVADRLERHA